MLDSVVLVVDEAVLVIVVPMGAVLSTATTSVNVALAPAGSVGSVAVITPATFVNIQPAGGVKETQVVFAGMVSVKDMPWASLGPRLLTTIV